MRLSVRRRGAVMMMVSTTLLVACGGGVMLPSGGGAGGGSSSQSMGGSGSQGEGGVPDLKCHPLPSEHAALGAWFSQYSNVFGVHLFASASTPCAKLEHAAGVMAQYLDNDADGLVDNEQVVAFMNSINAGIVMFATESEFESSQPEQLFQFDYELQDLYGEETHPEGSGPIGFDATLEEVLHLVTARGYSRVYKSELGEQAGSLLTNAMDLARGGHFKTVPASYPTEAWYHYNDQTCHYECMATEYFYWVLTSMLGAQAYAGRPEQIADEWELYSRDLVAATDTKAFALMTDPQYRLPTVLPDGKYAIAE